MRGAGVVGEEVHDLSQQRGSETASGPGGKSREQVGAGHGAKAFGDRSSQGKRSEVARARLRKAAHNEAQMKPSTIAGFSD